MNLRKTKLNSIRLTTLTAGSITLIAAMASVAVANVSNSTTTNGAQAGALTAQSLNQNSANLIGKQVTLTGKIDRMLGNGSYIIADSQNSKDPTNRVLIMTAPTDNSNSNSKMYSKQQAGVAGVNLKEGDSVRLNGKVEQFNVSSEVDAFSPKDHSETVSTVAESTPVLVVQPGGIQRQ